MMVRSTSPRPPILNKIRGNNSKSNPKKNRSSLITLGSNLQEIKAKEMIKTPLKIRRVTNLDPEVTLRKSINATVVKIL